MHSCETLVTIENRSELNLENFAIGLSLCVNIGLLYGHSNRFVKSIYKWIVVSAGFIVGAIYLLINLSRPFEGMHMIMWSIMTPLVFSCFEYCASRISFKAQGRDYRIALRNSSENSGLINEGGNIAKSDIAISLFLLLSAGFILLSVPLAIRAY